VYYGRLFAGKMQCILPGMYSRRATLPNRTFFLLGPRGTGKTTWLRATLPLTTAAAARVRWFDLLDDREVARLLRSPGSFSAEVRALPPGSWVVVDEVQRLPGLLAEVHGLLTEHPDAWRFALTGSSARKLRRAGVDLLPGRAINRRFFPLTIAERGFDVDLDEVLSFGGLPAVVAEPDRRTKVELLSAYVDNYLTQELRLDATVKDLASFTRFLDVATRCNAQVVNVSGLSRDAAVARTTVQGYFEVLTDTLVGDYLPSWAPALKVREAGHPKWYFFDAGVVRAATGRHFDPLGPDERGPLFETTILAELRAACDVLGLGGDLSYWSLPSATEVDVVWRRGRRAIGIEIKASERWRPEHNRGLSTLLESGAIEAAFAVYLGAAPQRFGLIEVLPVAEFCRRLWAGEILPLPA
jgi:predicted AAA+ superfamily ATPase